MRVKIGDGLPMKKETEVYFLDVRHTFLFLKKKLELNQKFSQIRHLRHLAEYMGLNEEVGVEKCQRNLPRHLRVSYLT